MKTKALLTTLILFLSIHSLGQTNLVESTILTDSTNNSIIIIDTLSKNSNDNYKEYKDPSLKVYPIPFLIVMLALLLL